MKRAVAFPLAAAAMCMATACGAGAPAGPPTPTAPEIQLVTQAPISAPHTVSVAYKEIPTKAGPGPESGLLAWTLIRTDPDRGRVYLSATQTGCTAPESIYLAETTSEIRITVAGPKPATDPCTEQQATLIGYVQLTAPISGRRIIGNH
jgi:hypothetical protein